MRVPAVTMAFAEVAAVVPRGLRRLFSANSSAFPFVPPPSAAAPALEQAEPNTNLFFSGLSKRTSSERLSEAFSRFGEVVHARVVTDRVSRYSKGFGFVRYATLKDAGTGIEGMGHKKCVAFIPVRLYWNRSYFSKAYSSSDTSEVADEVLEEILRSSGGASKFNENDYTALVNKLCRAGNLSSAANLLQSLQDRNIFLPNAKDGLLAAAGERHDFKLSCQIFEELLFSGKPLSTNSYLNLARAFMKVDDCTYLLQFVKEVSESALPASLTVINRILLAFADSRQIDKVLLIFTQMKGWECKPDLITYNTVLDILARSGRVSDMLQLFSMMKKDGVYPDIISYNTFLNGLRKIGRIDMCLVVYRKMCESGIQPDLLTYTAMIDSFGRSGNIEESLRLLGEMKQRHIRPSVYIYRALIDSLKKSGKLELAMELLEEMNSSSADLACPEDFKRKRKIVGH